MQSSELIERASPTRHKRVHRVYDALWRVDLPRKRGR